MANDTNEVVGIRLRGDNVELEFEGFLLLLRRLSEYRRIADAGRALSDTLLNFGMSQELWEAQAKMRGILDTDADDTALKEVQP